MADIERSTVVGANGSLKLRELQCQCNTDGIQDEIEHIEPYGFTSEPFTDGKTDAITIFFDNEHNHAVTINVADRRYRITSMQQGEVAMYDDKNRHIYLKRDGIEIDGVSDPITIKTSSDVNINCNNLNATCNGSATINCSASVTVKAPSILLDGNVTVTGSLITGTNSGAAASFGGSVSAQGDIVAGSISLQNHVHGGVQGGSSKTTKAE